MTNQHEQSLRRGGSFELILENLTKVFPGADGPGVAAVDRLSLTVAAGTFLTLCGPSGCGKTTTLRMIAGLETPTSGEICLAGQPLTRIPPNRRHIGLVFQSYALFPHLTVFDNVAYPLQVKKESAAVIRREVDEVLELLELAGLSQRYPNQLSGGQQQRVALARALVTRPSLLLFDEPLSNLDARLRIHVRAEIRRLQKALGITTVYVTHDQVEAMSISDEIAIMHEGSIEQIGRPEEVYFRPATKYTAEFIGRANLLSGEIVSADERSAAVRVLGHEFRLSVAEGQLSPGDQVVVMVRPESVYLTDSAQGDLVGTIRQSTFAGTTVEYAVSVGDTTLLITELGDLRMSPLKEGRRVALRFNSDRVHLIRAGGQARP
jgi:iron(III) transport system ATP-binding protein